jgi:hypothetical protein
MPACVLHLVSLSSSVPQSRFLSALSSSSLKPLIIAKVIRWIITPSQLSVPALLHPKSPWDLFVVTEGPSPLPADLRSMLADYWSITAGVPSRLVNGFADRNASILHPPPSSIPPLTGSLEKPRVASSAQGLEFTEDLRQWIDSFVSRSLPLQHVFVRAGRNFKITMDSYPHRGLETCPENDPHISFLQIPIAYD